VVISEETQWLAVAKVSADWDVVEEHELNVSDRMLNNVVVSKFFCIHCRLFFWCIA
jgi:hypothetical protein